MQKQPFGDGGSECWIIHELGQPWHGYHFKAFTIHAAPHALMTVQFKSPLDAFTQRLHRIRGIFQILKNRPIRDVKSGT